MDNDLDDARYAVYLIPPYHVARAVTEIHQMLQKQFGFAAAARFQVHATVKGFFEAREGPLASLIDSLDKVFARQRRFPVNFCGLHRDSLGLGLDISCLGQGPNSELMALRNQVWDAVRPFVAPDCAFTRQEGGRPFAPHITLAFRDIPTAMQDQVLDYLQDAPLPSEPFMAHRFQLLAFQSQDWEGPWEQTLSWRLIKSWQVASCQ